MVAILLVNLASLALFFMFIASFARFQAQVNNVVTSLSTSKDQAMQQIFAFFQPDGDKPSKFAIWIDTIAQIFSARIISSAEAALRGAKGGMMKGVNAAEQRDFIQQNPLMGMLGGKMGKNPIAVGLLSLLGQKLGSLGPSAESVPTNGSGQVKFKL